MKEFTEFLDEEASRISKHFTDKYPDFAKKGSNSIAMISPTRLLKEVDPVEYFKDWIPAISPQPSRLPGPRRKYKLGILIMAHGGADILENIKLQVNELDDGSSLILIHVDSHYKELHSAISTYISERDKAMNEALRPGKSPVPGNVMLVQKQYHGRWGHVTLVWVQLSGYWEMLDMADVDHFINLSSMNVPLRKGREIQRVLGMPKYANQSLIYSYKDYDYYELSAGRLMRPHIPDSDLHSKDNINHPDEAGLLYPPQPRWRVCKQHQWMILSREAVEHFRYNPEAATFLAFSESQFIPDEAFFCFVLHNNPQFKTKVINDNKHYLTFPAYSYHPKQLNMDDIDEIGHGDGDGEDNDPRFLFIRKVDVKDSRGRELMDWIIKNHIERHLKGDDEYVDLGGKEFVLLEKKDVEG
ncbi:hypothetical protein HDU67_006772 [Dinochytrium kinnereticum]|nr:hypothetical protein HDU67_006772 [Dinochytrium kinnereticum]